MEFPSNPTFEAVRLWRTEHRHEVPITVLPTAPQQPLITYTDSVPMYQSPISGVMDVNTRLAHEAQGRLEAAQDVSAIPGTTFADYPDVAWIRRLEAVKVARGRL